MTEGTEHGLYCSECGEPCLDPVPHLAREYNATYLLSPDTLCKTYAEMNKWGRRWRVIEALTGLSVKFYVDDMGKDTDFVTSEFAIPSFGEYSGWNTVGECIEEALYKHDRGAIERKRVPPATVQAWAEVLEEQSDYVARWLKGKSTYGVAGHVQRDKDRVR